jgi:NTP pyrophosphatase (non-canonical NTP hydrolase)
MQINEYQKLAVRTAIYPDHSYGGIVALTYCALKLNGEAGEVAEAIGKAMRDDDSVITRDRREHLKRELGDVLWYIANMAKELDFTLEDIAEANVLKLQDRKARGVLKGSGSDR